MAKGTIGWICPRCDVVHAPSVKRCECASRWADKIVVKPRRDEPIPSPHPTPLQYATPPDPPGSPPRIMGARFSGSPRIA